MAEVGGGLSANAAGVIGGNEKRRLAEALEGATALFLVLFPPIMGGTLADACPSTQPPSSPAGDPAAGSPPSLATQTFELPPPPAGQP